jgi:hypothetical protein
MAVAVFQQNFIYKNKQGARFDLWAINLLVPDVVEVIPFPRVQGGGKNAREKSQIGLKRQNPERRETKER